MNAKTHITLQSVLTAIQLMNVTSVVSNFNFLPPKYSAVLAFALATLQGAVGIYNHYFLPNGERAQ